MENPPLPTTRANSLPSCPMMTIRNNDNNNIRTSSFLLLILLVVLVLLPSETVAGGNYNNGGRFKGLPPPGPLPSSNLRHRGRSPHGYSSSSFSHGAGSASSREFFGDEKRRVQTGPNPLHNR